MNIVLIGYRCSGKTSVGKIIANRMKRSFLDTDMMIEDMAGYSIEEMVSMKGWTHFRDLEKGIIKEVSEESNQVIATGGGVVMDEDNVKNLKRNGFIVWLKGDIDVLKARMEEDHGSGQIRPSLTGANPMDEIKRVLDIRNSYYSRAGDFIIDTSRLSTEEVAELIIEEAKERIC